MINTILFDLDGTLVDTAPDFVITVNELLKEHNREPLEDLLIRNCVSDGARALIKMALQLDEEHPEFETNRLRLLDLYEQHIGKGSSLFPGMQALLNNIVKHQLRWGIVTNKPERFASPLIKQLFSNNPPCTVICPDHVSQSKPSPEGLLLACEQAQCDPSNAIYVGDHRRDIESGRAAGMDTIAVTFGYIKPDDDINQWNATHYVNHSDEIWPIINSYR